MSDIAIKVENLSKLYRLGEVGTGSLAHDVNRWWHRIRGKEDPYTQVGQANDRTKEMESEWVYALKDINFEVKQGEVLGIIGQNGAGKSTLLKILSRVTAPTSGELKVKGRIASLLEVGTGFHHDLTGRENIYLNGAILGMRKREIDQKLDEIVDFSGCVAYLDTPVKRYSSGMQVRLAFAVAAHLEPEILIVDEVLAVGDQRFQDKCLGKLRSIAETTGRTVLFVSHNLAAVSSLTKRCICLHEGSIRFVSHTHEVIDQYLNDVFSNDGAWTAPRNTTHPVQITKVAISDIHGNAAKEVEANEGLFIEVEHIVRQPIQHGIVEIWLMASDGAHLMTFGEHDANPSLLQLRPCGSFRSKIQIAANLLNLGRYYVKINCSSREKTFDSEDTVTFHVVETKERTAREGRQGYIIPLTRWHTHEI